MRPPVRLAIVACVLAACGHRTEPAVTVQVTCPDHETTLSVRGDQRIEQLCGAPWKALRIEHGDRTELVKPVAGREVWVRRAGSGAVIDVRASGAIVSSFDGVSEIAEDPPVSPGASVEVDANGTVTDFPLTKLQADEAGGGKARGVSLCTFASTQLAHVTHIEVSGDDAKPLAITLDECAARGYLLRVSGKGELRLRTTGGDHVFQRVTSIRLAL